MRRYQPLRPSAGTAIPTKLRIAVRARDIATVGGNGCVMRYLEPAHLCGGTMELDHVAASHGMGLKSPTEASNLLTLCAVGHRKKTENGRLWRPRLAEYLAQFEAVAR